MKNAVLSAKRAVQGKTNFMRPNGETGRNEDVMKAKRMISMYTRNDGKEVKELVNNLLKDRCKEECDFLGEELIEKRKSDLYEIAEETIKKAAPQWSGYAEVNYRSLLQWEVKEAIRDEIYRLIKLKRIDDFLNR